jgi:cellobiose phosphorylase
MCGDVYSQPPLQGRAGWSWYTGSAGWLYQAGLHHILGIEYKPDGFSIDPCIPSAWKDFSLEYRHQNRTFVIQVSNPSGVETGVRSVNVEGIQIEGDIIPYEHPSYGTTVTVMAVMGTLVK